MEINERIMKHLEMLRLLVKSTEAMITSAKEENFKMVEALAENRERLINIVRLLQDGIESEIQKISTQQSVDQMTVFKTWMKDVSELVEKNAILDEECLSILDHAKSETTKEISTVFKKRKKFQGYNLNNLKR